MSSGKFHKAIFTLSLVAINMLAYAQTKSDAWHRGKIQLIDNHVYEVNLRYVSTRSEGLLQVKEGSELVTISPLKAKSFEFFDSTVNEYRYFISVPTFSQHHQYQRKMFIEVLYAGSSISLLKYTDSFGMMATESLYLMDGETQAIFPYAVSKYSRKNRPVYINADTRLLYQLTGKHGKELKGYASSNQLRLRKPKDIIALLTYFDHLNNISAKGD